jgi:hypothetical protein
MRKLLLHLRIWDAQDLESVCGEEGVAFGVALLLVIVDFAIELDGEPALQTAEIDHKRSDRVLPPELVAIYAAIAQRLPQQGFRRRFPDAEVACRRHIARMETVVHLMSVAYRDRP